MFLEILFASHPWHHQNLETNKPTTQARVLRWRWYSKHHRGAHCYSKPKLSKWPSGISWAPYWSKPLKARRSRARQALLHYLHTINISLQFCQVVIYRASLSSLCHLIWRQWLIYLCSSHMPLGEGHFISPQMLSVSCTFALGRFIFRLPFDLICPSNGAISRLMTQRFCQFDRITVHMETMSGVNVNHDAEVTRKATTAAISHVF